MRLAGLVLLLAAVSMPAQVTYERIVNQAKEPGNWLTYQGDYGAVRHRELNQINSENVRNLRVEWIYQTGISGAFETVPLVVDGVMYISGGEGTAMALDPRTGRQYWRYKYNMPRDVKLCCGGVNRGLAMLGTRLFLTTPDA